MVRCSSLFSQLIWVFSRRQFHELVVKHRAERYAKGFNSWDQFVAMLFCPLAQAKSLREICGGLATWRYARKRLRKTAASDSRTSCFV